MTKPKIAHCLNATDCAKNNDADSCYFPYCEKNSDCSNAICDIKNKTCSFGVCAPTQGHVPPNPPIEPCGYSNVGSRCSKNKYTFCVTDENKLFSACCPQFPGHPTIATLTGDPNNPVLNCMPI